MQIKAVFLDLDGVILDSEKLYSKFWKQAAEELGYTLTDAVVLQLRSCDSSIARSVIESALGSKEAYDQIRAKRKTLMNEYLDNSTIELKPGVLEFLEAASHFEVRRVIVTSAALDRKKQILDRYGVSDYIDEFITVKDVKRSKPYPDIYLHACQRLNLQPYECIAIEDSPNGVESAYSAGINVIMVPDLSEPDSELRKKCIVVPSIKEVVKYLKTEKELS